MIKTKDGVYVIGIDHGYGNIKTVNTVTPTGITAYDSEPTFSGNVLESGGVYFTIGEGHKAYIINEAEDEDYFHITQYAIARELARENITEADVHIAAGLPLTWVRTQRDSFREYLMQQESMEFTLNKKHFSVRIVGCNVYPQGYPAIINKLSEMNGTTMLADIGNGTMNIMYFLNRRPIESKCYTEKMGVNQCLIAAKNEVMNRYGVTIDDTIIEQIIRTGKADISQRYLDTIRTVISVYCNRIFETLQKYEYDSDLMRLFIVGGGARVIRSFGKYDADRVTIVDDICAAAKGFEYLASVQLAKR